jgi:DNA (cytosine-5)-methyltransferase 1
MKKLTFIDLFCGIGGFRLALENLGSKCLFSAEINAHACEMYEQNFAENPFCDITKLDASALPDFNILCAGFPCQAFSRAGRQQGFNDARGTLFFDVCRIIAAKKPQALLLENVKNLVNHDGGNTLRVILENLDTLGYEVSWKILSARHFGVPQSRERIILVGIRKETAQNSVFDFSMIETTDTPVCIQNILEKKVDQTLFLAENDYTLLKNHHPKEKTGLIFSGYRNKNMRKNGVLEGTEHLSRSHKQSSRIYHVMGTHPTLSSQESAGRYFIELKSGKVRKLTMLECFRLMGFPDNYKKIGSQANLYARIGNSVCVPMIQAVAKELIKMITINNQKND